MTGTETAAGQLVADRELEDLRAAIERREGEYLADLEELVNIDSGSYTSAGVDQVGKRVAALLAELGGAVEVRASPELGATVVGRFRGPPGAPRALVIGHMDTVFDEGTARSRPFRVEGERAFGPGVTDMKSGLLAGLYALAGLRDTARQPGSARTEPVEGGLAWLPFEELVYVANPDEEIGSPASSLVIRAEAARANVCFVLECARENGDIVSSRKGVLDLRLTVRGRAAHAGVEPWKGRSAALEAAHKTIAVHELNGRWEGVTANVGVIRGGTRPNVVTEETSLEIDLRSPTRDGLEAAEAAVREIAATSTVPDTSCEVEQMGRHWPMEKLGPTDRLVEHALALAGRLGFPLTDTATGGASDANTTAGLGVPTLDGLGPVGGNDHAPSEYLELPSIVPRVTLLAALLLVTARDPETLGWGPTRTNA